MPDGGPPPTAARREALLFWGVAVVVLAAGLGLREPWPSDEPRYALVARQMLDSGQWLFPMRGDTLYPDKPPLLMWLQAMAMAVTGELRVAFRLPTLLASLGTLWLVRDLGARLWTREAGAAAGWALLFAIQFTFQAQRAQIDPLLVSCTTLSVYGLLRHLLAGPDWRMWALGWFAAGLGVLSKGVGVVALLVLLPALAARWRDWPGVAAMAPRSARFWLGPLALLLPVLAWLVPMLLAVRGSGDPALQAYADDLLFRQTATRYADPWHHVQPAWYFAGVIATQWLPAVAAVPFAWRGWREAWRARDPRTWVPLGWVVLVLLFFSASPGKREVYILPALPVLCLVLGPWLHAIARRPAARGLALAMTGSLAGVLLVAGAMAVSGAPSFETGLAADRGVDQATTDALGWVLLAMGTWMLGSLLWFGRRQAVPGLLAAMAGLWVLVGWGAAPILNDASSSRGLMRDVGRIIGPDAELGLVAWKEQTLLMADRPARTFGFSEPLATQWASARAWQARAPGRRWLLLEDDALGGCVDLERARHAGRANRRDWWLVPAAAVRPGCAPAP